MEAKGAKLSPKFANKNSHETVNSSSNNVDVVDRANWSNPIEFILSCMNFAIGLGNVGIFKVIFLKKILKV
jgi:hypothetical protein